MQSKPFRLVLCQPLIVRAGILAFTFLLSSILLVSYLEDGETGKAWLYAIGVGLLGGSFGTYKTVLSVDRNREKLKIRTSFLLLSFHQDMLLSELQEIVIYADRYSKGVTYRVAISAGDEVSLKSYPQYEMAKRVVEEITTEIPMRFVDHSCEPPQVIDARGQEDGVGQVKKFQKVMIPPKPEFMKFQVEPMVNKLEMSGPERPGFAIGIAVVLSILMIGFALFEGASATQPIIAFLIGTMLCLATAVFCFWRVEISASADGLSLSYRGPLRKKHRSWQVQDVEAVFYGDTRLSHRKGVVIIRTKDGEHILSGRIKAEEGDYLAAMIKDYLSR